MFKRTAINRILFFVFFDFLIIIFSIISAFLIRFEGKIPFEYFSEGIIETIIVLSLVFLIPIFYFFNLYSFSWSFVSSRELISLLKASTLGFIFISFSIFIFKKFEGFPRSTLIISYILVFLLAGAVRFSKRIYIDTFKEERKEKRKTLIVGAGEAGEQILRSIISGNSIYNPVGFVDDNLVKQGVLIHGMRVFGKIESIPSIIEREKIEEMIIALPSANSLIIRRAVELGRNSGIKKIKIIPPIEEIMKGDISFNVLRDINVEDLLKRDSISFEEDKIEKFIKDKRVLVTGGAGSIGSELVRQIARFNPSILIVLDQDETGIFNISKEFENSKINFIVGDVRDKNKIENIFDNFKPEIIFHAAAYKHVGLMEDNPDEAVKNNIFGTKNIAEIAKEKGIGKFIFISTDKAVNPTSVMGMTKRIGEMICRNLNNEESRFVSVRFGNVLGSRGSIVPIFKEQIRRGGPVEVTHPDMKRYFMMTSEAVALVLQSGEMSEGGEVFVLDMGEPIKIIDLAREMIRLSGFEPDKEIPIVFTSPKKGEKLFEEILTSEEGTVATKNKKIFKAVLKDKIREDNFTSLLDSLESKIEKEKIKDILKNFLSLN